MSKCQFFWDPATEENPRVTRCPYRNRPWHECYGGEYGHQGVHTCRCTATRPAPAPVPCDNCGVLCFEHSQAAWVHEDGEEFCADGIHRAPGYIPPGSTESEDSGAGKSEGNPKDKPKRAATQGDN